MNDQDIFSHNEDKDRMPEIIKLLKSQEAVLFIGAGASKRVGYPDWPELLKKLEKLATQCGNRFKQNEKQLKYQPLEYAEKIKKHIIKQEGDLRRYYGLIDREFEPKQYPVNKLDFHKTLVRLGFKGILTTNYDVVIEEAIKDFGDTIVDYSFVVNENTAGQVHRYFLTMGDPYKLGVAHLHGIYNDPERIVLSIKDYEKVYDPPINQEISILNFFKRFLLQILRRENQIQRSTDWMLHRKFLWAVLATCRVVFVGFSLKDPYFEKILKTVSDDLWRMGRPVHFAIMSISSEIIDASKTLHKAQEFKEKYGIETIFYSDTDGTHEALEKLVFEIANELGVPVPSDTFPPDSPSESEDKLDIVKNASQRMARRIGDEN